MGLSMSRGFMVTGGGASGRGHMERGNRDGGRDGEHQTRAKLETRRLAPTGPTRLASDHHVAYTVNYPDRCPFSSRQWASHRPVCSRTNKTTLFFFKYLSRFVYLRTEGTINV